MAQPTIKLVQKLKGKSRKIRCNNNNKVREAHKHTHTQKNLKIMEKINMEGVSKNGSDFRRHHQLKLDCYEPGSKEQLPFQRTLR